MPEAQPLAVGNCFHRITCEACSVGARETCVAIVAKDFDQFFSSADRTPWGLAGSGTARTRHCVTVTLRTGVDRTKRLPPGRSGRRESWPTLRYQVQGPG